MGSFLTDGPVPKTDHVSMDEPCVMLFEVNSPAADSSSLRRWRHIWVIRDDAGAEYREDIGLASDYGDAFVLPGGEPDYGIDGIVETVGRLIDCANDIKAHPFDSEGVVRTDLIGAYHDVMDQRQFILEGNTP